MKSHEQLILGSSLETILAESQNMIPVISEYQFQRDVLDILENPFGQDALRQYSVYVGELTKPLNVVSDSDRSQVLFTVPALVQAPVPSIASQNGMTTYSFMRSLSRDVDLGSHNLNEKISQYMLQITQTPDYIEVVIRPIIAILARYGRSMQQRPPQINEPTPMQAASTTHSSFTDEYDD